MAVFAAAMGGYAVCVVVAIGLILLGVLLLIAGGELLLRGAVGLATMLRLTPAVIGLTVVAAGTSVPELAVSAVAASQGNADVAVANVVGSNIFNITVILGLCALLRPIAIRGNTLRLEYPVLLAASVLGLVVAWNGLIGRAEGAICLLGYVAFTAYLVRLVRRQMSRAEAAPIETEVESLATTAHHPRLWLSILLLLVGVALLCGGAEATVRGAVQIAQRLGMSERVIGLTIVSAGTGLPEVVASLVSAIRGRSDVAIGNVIGSNIFNLLNVLGITAIIRPLPVQPGLIHSDFWWMIGVTVLLLPIMISGGRIRRWEGALLLTTYCTYIALLLVH